MADLESRAIKRGVGLKSHIPGHVDLESRPVATALLARTLINDAILATPRGGHVTVTVDTSGRDATLSVADEGSSIPEDALGALLSARLDPATLGRPSTIALFWAHMLAEHLGTQIELATAGGAEGQRGVQPETAHGIRLFVRFTGT